MQFKHCLAAAALTLAASTASAALTTFVGTFIPEGANNPSGSGTVHIVYDSSDNTLDFDVIFSGLSSPTRAAHIHCCTAIAEVGNAGVVVEPPSLVNFPVGVTAGHYVANVDLDEAGNINPDFINNVNFGNGSLTKAIEVLLAGMSDGHAYFNIHTDANRAGEIRAYLQVPEPASWALALGAIGLLGAARRSTH